MLEKKDIRELSFEELVENFESVGEKKFRAKQVYDWIWNKGISSFEEMSNISLTLRQYLNSNYSFDSIKITHQLRSVDETTKVLFDSFDNNNFEGVLIPGKDRITACISTQVGCALNCAFCATGKLGFKRNLGVGEIFEQVFQLNKLSEQIFGRKLSNIVIMGMGEPLLNYENTMKAVEHICRETGLGFSPQRITLSTAGIVDGIKRMADENVKINLSISLHSAISSKRSEIMPINKKYSIQQLRDALKYYYDKTGRRITYEYLLLGGVNDSNEDAIALTEFTKISPCKLNIIEYNPGGNDKFKSPDKTATENFIRHIESKNLVVTLRKSKGQDINAACGQLANKKQ